MQQLLEGEVRVMACHAIGHGADTFSYCQWRSALNGQERYHGTMVGATEGRFGRLQRSSKLARGSPMLVLALRLNQRLRFCTHMTAAGRFSGNSTIENTIPWLRSPATTV